VHWGATSQDVIDTALVLELRAGIDALDADLAPAIAALAMRAQKERHQLMAARTLLQQAVPMPFGLKLAGYAAALARSRARLERLRAQALVLQLGGAGGTLGALDPNGLAVAQKVAELLGLPLPEAPWHSHRDRLAEVAAALAILAGTCGKIARDVALLMQTEVGEVSEPAVPGRGASSAMPHKRNPVASVAALAAANLAPNLAAAIIGGQVQEHERAVGGWQAEWVSFPTLLLVVSGAVAAIRDIADGFEVHGARMRENLDRTGGLIMAESLAMALGAKLGKKQAHALVAELCRKAEATRGALHTVAAADARVTAHLSVAEIEKILDPQIENGAAQSFIERLLASIPQRAP
jgi:3-carboxy-cis,cis-muconate cycloisomerase